MSLCLPPQQLPEGDPHIFDDYITTHPRTVANFSAMKNGAYWFERLLIIEHSWKRKITGALAASSVIVSDVSELPDQTSSLSEHTYDCVYSGGGLGILHAATMSFIHKKRVLLFDRYSAGITHRDWNISLKELNEFVTIGLFTNEEIRSVIEREYSGGFIRFFDAGIDDISTKDLWLKNVLDVAVSANKLLALAKNRFLDSGGVLIDSAEFLGVASTNDSEYCTIALSHARNVSHLKARVFVDCMGAYSPIAMQLNKNTPFTHCCPTVGTISRGFATGTDANLVNPDVGEILVTLDDADSQGRQLIWEGFPSKDNEFVTYLFFYDSIDSLSNKSLLDLYEIFFEKLPSYKVLSPSFDIGRPAFGMIPSMIHRKPWNGRSSAANNILCIGDAAALSSPLTYCGFGSFVRTLARTTTLLSFALTHSLLQKNTLSRINAYEPNVAIAANFAQYLVGKKSYAPTTVNQTMNSILFVLKKLPPAVGEELFRDRLSWNSYNKLMSSVPVYIPTAYSMLLRHGFRGAITWSINFLSFSFFSLRKAMYNNSKKEEVNLETLSPERAFTELWKFYTYKYLTK